MDKAILYSLLEQYVYNTDKEQIILDIKRTFITKDIEIFIKKVSYLHSF